MLMAERALVSFQSTYGWKVGVNASVAIVTLGAGGSIDTESSQVRLLASFSTRLADVQFEPGRLEDQPSFALRAWHTDVPLLFKSLLWGVSGTQDRADQFSS
jgi:hypothetical protein